MKLSRTIENPTAGRRGEQGSATLVVFILLTLLVAMVIGNTRTLHHLKTELRLVEQKQLQRCQPPATNAVPERLVPAPNP